MVPSREQILSDVLARLEQLADDWEYEDKITADTFFFRDMGLESLDVVVMATDVQEYYGQSLPFPDFFAAVGQRERRDVTVGEWVDFIHHNLAQIAV